LPTYTHSFKWFVDLQSGVVREFPVGIGILLKGNRTDTPP
jgi:hypothetical protein